MDPNLMPTAHHRQPRRFKKCKSATFTLDGMAYTIGKIYVYNICERMAPRHEPINTYHLYLFMM